MAIDRQYRLPLGLISIFIGGALLYHSYSSPFTTSTPAEQSTANFLAFFYGPFLILSTFLDFPSLWRRL